MSNYEWWRDELRLTIDEAAVSKGSAGVGIRKNNGNQYVILVPPNERPKAAAALAGDGYEVVEKIADWEREFLARQYPDPADVQVGWVVEVSTTRQGTVTEVMPVDVRYLFRIDFGDGDAELIDSLRGDVTIRVLSRPDEREPDELAALRKVLGNYSFLAPMLHAAGVRAPEATS